MKNKLVRFISLSMIAIMLAGCTNPLAKDKEGKDADVEVDANINTAIEGLTFHVGESVYPDQLVYVDYTRPNNGIVLYSADGTEADSFIPTDALIGQQSVGVRIKYTDEEGPVDIVVPITIAPAEQQASTDTEPAAGSSLTGTPYTVEMDGHSITYVDDKSGFPVNYDKIDTSKTTLNFKGVDIDGVKVELNLIPSAKSASDITVNTNNADASGEHKVLSFATVSIPFASSEFTMTVIPSTSSGDWTGLINALENGSSVEDYFAGIDEETQSSLNQEVSNNNKVLSSSSLKTIASYIQGRCYEGNGNGPVSTDDIDPSNPAGVVDAEGNVIALTYEQQHPTFYEWRESEILYRRWVYLPDPEMDMKYMGTMMWRDGRIIRLIDDLIAATGTVYSQYSDGTTPGGGNTTTKTEATLKGPDGEVKISTKDTPVYKIEDSNSNRVTIVSDQNGYFIYELMTKASFNTSIDSKLFQVTEKDPNTEITVSEGESVTTNIGTFKCYNVKYVTNGASVIRAYCYYLDLGDKYLVLHGLDNPMNITEATAFLKDTL